MITLYHLAPELILLAFGILIILLDLVWRDRTGNRLNTVALLGFLAAFVMSVILFWPALAGWNVPTTVALFCGSCPLALPAGAAMSQVKDALYASDNFTNFFRIVATLTGLVVLLMTFDYMKGRTRNRGEFIGIFFFAVASIILMAGSTNLLMIYLSTEFLSYTSYILTGFFRDDKKSNEAAIKYFLYGAITSATMLYGISLFYGATGTLDLLAVGDALKNAAGSQLLALFAVGLMLAGFGFKISLVPFHQWAPDAYEGAPTPVTAFLSVGPKSAGFAILIRTLLLGLMPFQVEWAAMLAVIAVLTMTVGNIIALTENNLKRLFAYSSIAQAGYMLIGLVAVSLDPNAIWFGGVNGILIYILAYLFTNLGAFICIVAIENATGATTIPEYAGMIRRSPWLAVLLTIFFLSLAGIPPTAGFIGKFWVFLAAINVQQYALAVIAVLNSVLSIVYYFRVVQPMFFAPAVDETRVGIGRWLQAALLISAVMVFVIAIVPTPFLNLATRSAAEMFGLGMR